MTTEQLENLKRLREYFNSLYLYRSGQVRSWPYPDGPSEDEVQLMMEAYASLIDPEEKRENPNLKNSYLPEFAQEIVNKIDGFIAHLAFHPDDKSEEEKLTPNTLGPEIVAAYDEYLQKKPSPPPKKRRGLGRKPKAPYFEETLEKRVEIKKEELSQKRLTETVIKNHEEAVRKIKDFFAEVLQDPEVLPSLSPEDRESLPERLAKTVGENPRVKELRDFLEGAFSQGETLASLRKWFAEKKEDFEKGRLAGAEFERAKNISALIYFSSEDGLLTETPDPYLPGSKVQVPVSSKEAFEEGFARVVKFLKTQFNLPEEEVNSFVKKANEQAATVQDSLLTALRSQNLSFISSSPDFARLYFGQSMLDQFFLVTAFVDKLLPENSSFGEKRVFSAEFFIHLKNQIGENPERNPFLKSPDDFLTFLADEVKNFVSTHPIYKHIDKYQRLNPKETLEKFPDIAAGLKQTYHSAYSAIHSPNALSPQERKALSFPAEEKIRENIRQCFYISEDRTFFGRLSSFSRLGLVSQKRENLELLLKFFADPEIIKTDEKIRKIAEESYVLKLDPLQRKNAAALTSFLIEHPSFHNFFIRQKAKIEMVPAIKETLNLIFSDPTYFLFIPKIFLIYEKYYFKMYLKEGLASGIIWIKIPILKKSWQFTPFKKLYFGHIKNAQLLDYLKKSGGKIPLGLKIRVSAGRGFGKIWNFLWAEDYYGFHTFLFSNPKKWAIEKVKEWLRPKVIKVFRVAVRKIRKFVYKSILKIFGKKLGAQIIRKLAKNVILKAFGALLGLTVPGPGWLGTVVLIYSLLRDLFPFIKKLEKIILLGIGLLFYGVLTLIGKLFAAIGGFLGSAVSALGGLASSFFGGLTTVTVSAPVAAIGAGVGGLAGITIFNNLVTYSTLVDYQKTAAPIFFNNCYIADIHKTDVLTDENKTVFINKYKTVFPNSLLEKKADEVINKSVAAGFNPALALAIWGEESHFSNYGTSGGEENVLEGNDFGCGVKCPESRPINFDESLDCFVAQRASCNNQCLSSSDFNSFMECYGPAAENPNFISNVLSFYRDLVPSGENAIKCPGGTTGEFASKLINSLISCYDNNGVINKESFNDNGECLKTQGIPQKSINYLVSSVNTYSALQCVGFTKAVVASKGGTVSGFLSASYENAKDYFRSIPGYQLVDKEKKNVMVGDLAIFDGNFGHIGVVIEVRGEGESSQFRIAQAIGVANDGSWYGLVNESGWFHISWPNLLGFLRQNM